MVTKGLDSSKVLWFKSYDVNIELPEIMRRVSSRMKGEKEMWLSELKGHLRKAEKGSFRRNMLSIGLHKRFAIPLSCLLLGLMVKSRARSWGVALSVVIFTVYCIVLSSADSPGGTGTINPALAMRIPEIVLGVATLALVW
jgi:lipopolysaccharide export system permease protein